MSELCFLSVPRSTTQFSEFLIKNFCILKIYFETFLLQRFQELKCWALCFHYEEQYEKKMDDAEQGVAVHVAKPSGAWEVEAERAL